MTQLGRLNSSIQNLAGINNINTSGDGENINKAAVMHHASYTSPKRKKGKINRPSEVRYSIGGQNRNGEEINSEEDYYQGEAFEASSPNT